MWNARYSTRGTPRPGARFVNKRLIRRRPDTLSPSAHALPPALHRPTHASIARSDPIRFDPIRSDPIRCRLSSDGRRSLNKSSSPSFPSSRSSARDLTPAEAYRAAASGVNATGTRARGGSGGGRGDRHAAHAVGPDMDDSIMRGTGANSVGPSKPDGAGGGDDAVAELAKKFRWAVMCLPCREFDSSLALLVGRSQPLWRLPDTDVV